MFDYDVNSCCREIRNPLEQEEHQGKGKTKQPPINIYFDCETMTTKRMKHIPYLVCLKSDDEKQTFKSKYCFGEMLDHLAQKYGSENVGDDVQTLNVRT